MADPVNPEVIEPPAVPAEPAQPAPSYITTEQFMTFQQNMQQMMNDGLRSVAQMVGSTNQPPPVMHDDPEPTDDEIDAAALEGKGVGRAVKRATAAAMKRLERQTQQQVDQIQGVGLPALAEQAFMLAKQNWPHYDKYKTEINAALNQLQPEQRTSPMLLSKVYSMVIGDHQAELEKEAVEKAIRQNREAPDSGATGSTRTPKADDPMAPTKLFSAEDLNNLNRSGKSIEHIARRLGKTPEQYLETVRKYNERMQGKAA